VDTLTKAKQVEGKYRADSVDEDVFDKRKSPGIDTIWKKYLKWAMVNKRSWRDDETRWNKHISELLGNRPMNKIMPKDVEAILERMRDKKWERDLSKKKSKVAPKPYSPATIKHVLVLVKRVFNWAIKNDLYYGANPANKVTTPMFDNQVTNPMTKADLEKLLTYLSSWENERAALLTKFALFSGRRRSEILHLKWNNVNFDDGYVTFTGSHTKNKYTQTIPMNQSCMAILNRCHELKLSHWVFPSSTGAFYTTFENTWKRLKKRLALPYRFHDIRHSFASYLASSGQVDILTLKELLGHRELKMTQRYAHLINGALQRGANVADDIFSIPNLEKQTKSRIT
jgi:integrase